MIQWLAAAYLVPLALILAALLRWFRPRTLRRRLVVVGISVVWPALALIIFTGR